MQKIPKRITKYVKRLAAEYGVDSAVAMNLLDEVYDSELSWGELKKEFAKRFIHLIKGGELRERFREKYLHGDREEEYRGAQEEYVDRVMEESFKQVKAKHPYKDVMVKYIRALMESENINMLVVYGRRGMGKTTLVLSTLSEMGHSYIYLNGVTAYKLYEVGAKAPESIIVLDDTTLDERMIRVLKAMGDSRRERRVTWVSKSTESIEDKYIFTGKVILITNDEDFGADEHYRALFDRALPLRVELSPVEIMGAIREIVGDEVYHKFREALERLEEMANVKKEHIMAMVTLRTGILFKDALKEGEDFALGVLAEKILESAEELRDALEMPYREWREVHGKSRRTYYNYKNMAKRLVQISAGCVQKWCKTSAKVVQGIKRDIKSQEGGTTHEPGGDL